MDPAMMEGIADDWVDELNGLPAWAIQKACQWWIGADNPDRRKRPLPGDISQRARKEMGIIRCAELALERHDQNRMPLRLAHD
ncbi:hypothetical protein [Roseovarius sp. MMSF_3281]|uniref:hypothetical protein n=1 Tax=Roseovarius sp. MMSF_3281 TaxID=3046694 RepID=UPI00273FFB03|nr:hypothetical protein [Roseovarius sp. MMSF_3281]